MYLTQNISNMINDLSHFIKYKNLVCLFLLLSNLHLMSQISFEEQLIIDNINSTYGSSEIEIADIDGDGDLDIFANGRLENKLVWYENLDGQGTFSDERIISSQEDSVSNLFAADVDGDNDIDIIYSIGDGMIFWYENEDGAGNFGFFRIFIAGQLTNIRDVTAGDIDNDGDLDIITSFSNGDKIDWYRNQNGNGTSWFGISIDLNANDSRNLHLTDIDMDGDLDLFSSQYQSDSLIWYPNDEAQDGTNFSQPIVIYTSDSNSLAINSGDLDGDGDIDLLSSWSNSESLVWHENLDGEGTFAIPQIINDIIGAPNDIITDDLDQDGDIDIVIASSINQDNEIAWYENLDGNGNFGNPNFVTQVHDTPLDIEVGDINNDGDLEIFSVHLNGSKVAWFENQDGLGSYGLENIINRHVHLPFSVFSADIDNDGDQDIISASLDDNKLAWFENLDGNGNFSQIKVISSEIYRPTDIHIGDIDGDNDIDIIVSGSTINESAIAWFENLDGLGNFGNSNSILPEDFEFSVDSVYLEDIDGDFDLDILFTASGEYDVAWLENIDGLGNFGPPIQISDFQNDPRAIIAKDIDGDGDNDVIVAASFNNAINWFENLDGMGNFGSRQIVDGPSENITEIFASDIDNDGDIDLFSASKDDHKIAWYKNQDGLGDFSPQQVITDEAFSAEFVFTQDIDGDGNLDVLSASSNKIAWYKNLDGLGAFGPQIIITNDLDGANALFASDIDGDSDIDVVACAGEDDTIVWYENLGVLQNQILGFIHFNDNDECNESENMPASNLLVITENGENTFATFSQSNGSYILYTNEGEFTTTISSSLNSYFDILPGTNSSVFEDSNNIDENNNFCIVPNQAINDVNIILYPLRAARPGFDISYELVYTNTGTLFSSGSIELNYDHTKMNFLNANVDIVNQTDSSITFDYNDLQPLSFGHIELDFNILSPPTTEIDDILAFEASIIPNEGIDETPEDNIHTRNQVVIGSFDPNDILVLEGPEIAIENVDEYLHYIIRFQNTGTADAINVRITNQLDANLNWTTIQLESLSHPGVINITNGNEVEFLFEGINLPAEIDDAEGSNGFIAYKIKPIEGINVGDTIFNDASIFFDFNPPILTNIVSTTVVEEVLSLINKEVSSQIQLYPNPSENIININSNIILTKVEVYNVTGSKIIDEINSNGIDLINIKNVTSGIYFVKLFNENGSSSIHKIIRQ